MDPKRRELLKSVDILDEISTLRPMGDMVHINDLLGEAHGLGRNAFKPHPFDKHWAQRSIPDPAGLVAVNEQVDKVSVKSDVG